MGASPSAEVLLKSFLSDPDEAVIGFLIDGTIFLWNATAEALYGYTAEELIGKSAACLLPVYEVREFDNLLSDPTRAVKATTIPLQRLHKSGLRISLHVRRTLILNPQGQTLGVLERARDSCSELTRTATEAHLQLLVEKLPLHFWTTDRRLDITSHWASKARLSSDFPSNPTGRSIQEFLRIPEATKPPVKQHSLALRGISSRIEYASPKRLYDISIEPYFGPDGNVIGCVGMALDITERRKSEDEIRYRATHDGLTGLANYREFVDSLEREVRRTGRTGQPFALLLLDLDDLKTINDRFGHLTGNLALKRLACIMKEHCRATEIAARFGGDEFAILLLDANAGRAQKVGERIRSCLRQHPDSPTLSVSLGLSVFPEDGPSASDLLEAADKRLYQDKKARPNRDAPQVEQKSQAQS
jgi:diguanylate cyclase (GGDEF)-like protein/PAS domain S-box-containing protein